MIGLASPEATAQAFGRAVFTSIKPSTIPITGFLPNTRKADQEIRAGKKAKLYLSKRLYKYKNLMQQKLLRLSRQFKNRIIINRTTNPHEQTRCYDGW